MDKKFDLENWVSSLIKSEARPMTKKESELFFHVMFAESLPIEDLQKIEEDASAQGDFLFNILNKRCEVFGLNISIPAKLFLPGICMNPAEVVMYFTVFMYKQFKTGARIDMDYIANLFSNGFPTEDSLKKHWELQKYINRSTGSDNFIDRINYNNMTVEY